MDKTQIHNQTLSGVVVSDFNAANFCQALMQGDENPHLDVVVTPLGQMVPSLLEGDGWPKSPDFSVVWTRPESVMPTFGRVLNFEPFELDVLTEEVHAFADLILKAVDRASMMFVMSWTLPTWNRGRTLLDLQPGLGLRHALSHMNIELTRVLGDVPNVYILDAARWVSLVGREAFSAKLWFLAKVPFSQAVFVEAVQDIKAGLRGVLGGARKVILLDLDNTLWGGEVGEVGVNGLRLGGHDAVGEAFVAFQQALKTLTRQGVLLGILSRNDEKTALEAIEAHPEMVLRVDDFVGWRIDWGDKAENAVALLDELNLGLESAVFIDDQPVERARVREALPEVEVPDWPKDRMHYVQALQALRCFDTAGVSDEDRKRTGMYVSERKRRALKQTVVSVDGWFARLQTRVSVSILNDANVARATQLLNRTNQMNLRTRRLSEAELKAWSQEKDRSVWVFRVADAFGDSGICGLAGLDVNDGVAEVSDFVLSCRVMGRGVEATMLHVMTDYVHKNDLLEVRAIYERTLRNEPCYAFFVESRWSRQGDTFIWRDGVFAKPEYVEVISDE
jgi:FkbH-like protein